MRLLVPLLLLPPLVECASYVAGRVLQSRWGMYRDPVEGELTDYDTYMAERHPRLGWPGEVRKGNGWYEADGSCVSPANGLLADEEWLVSLYGDSFTWGRNDGATADEAWGNQLALLLGKRVKNFGVPAYGTDQAYLRYLEQEDQARVVVLGHMTEDLARNLTRMRDLLGRGKQELAFKPRFVLDAQGELQLIPLPDLSEAEYRRLVGLDDPPLHLEQESFAPGGPTGAVRLRFPYSLAMARNCGYWRFKARLGGYPDVAPLYRPGHPLRGLELTHAILRAFAREAARREQQHLVVLFPGPADAEWMERTGEDLQEELARRLQADGVRVLRFAPHLMEHMAGRPVETAFRLSHFRRELNPFVARVVLEELVAMGVTGPSGR